VTGLSVAQRGTALEVRYTAPRLTTAGVRLPVLEVELLRADVEGDLERVATRQRRAVAPGESLVDTLSLPAAGTTVRVAARAIWRGAGSVLGTPVTLTVRAPVPPPTGLVAELRPAGVALAWVAPPLPPPSPTPLPSASPFASSSESASPTPAAPASPAPSSTPPATPDIPPAVPVASPPPESPGLAPAPPPPVGAPAASPPAASPAPAPAEPAASPSADPMQPSPAPGAASPASDPMQPSPAPGAASPSPSPAPTPAPFAWRFHVYRRDAAGSYDDPLTPSPVALEKFVDDTAAAGASWCYMVRAVLSTAPLVESVDSPEACVTVEDVFPPASPSGVTALVRDDGVEVSWSPSTEGDLAGYRIYRTEPDGAPVRLGEAPLTETRFLDPSPRPGARYSVTAVDGRGNESPASPPVEAVSP
jgi:hypothetical protein